MTTDATDHASELLATIPHPDDVRRRLGQTMRQAQMLRQLLRLSERKARELPNAKGQQKGVVNG